VNSLPKTVTRQRRGCDLNPGPSAPESSTQTTRLPSHPSKQGVARNFCLGGPNTPRKIFVNTDQARNHSSQSDGTEYLGILSSLVGYLISAAQQSCDMTALLHCLQVFRLTKPHLMHSTIPPKVQPTLFSTLHSMVDITNLHTHTHTSLTALFPELPG